MEVAVVGGGIVGLSSAYYLSEAGATVTVYEKGSLGNGSTERSLGGIRRQFSTPVNVELSKASIPVWRDFEETFGIDIDFRKPGYLFLARTPETAADLEATVAMHHDHGVPTQLLEPAEATTHCPELETGRYRAASYLETDGFADPHLALQGFANVLRDRAVDVHTRSEVEDVIVADGDRSSGVSGVIAEGERHSVDFVVNAGGPWGRRVAEMAGVRLPVAPKRRSALVVEPSPAVPETVPLTIDLDTGSYFRPERDGSALVGGHFTPEADPDADPDRFDESVGMDYAMRALEEAREVADYFGPETRFKRGWAGLYAVTPDNHPIIEETVPGFISAVGFSGHGFMHAPATGQLVTELVMDGAASLVDIEPLTSERFERGEPIEEQHVA